MERVRQIIFDQHFHPYQIAPTCLINIDQLAGQHIGAVWRHLWVYEHKILPLIFDKIVFQIIDFWFNYLIISKKSVISFYDKNIKGLPQHDLNQYHLSQFPLKYTIWSIVFWQRNYMIPSHSS